MDTTVLDNINRFLDLIEPPYGDLYDCLPSLTLDIADQVSQIVPSSAAELHHLNGIHRELSVSIFNEIQREQVMNLAIFPLVFSKISATGIGLYQFINYLEDALERGVVSRHVVTDSIRVYLDGAGFSLDEYENVTPDELSPPEHHIEAIFRLISIGVNASTSDFLEYVLDSLLTNEVGRPSWAGYGVLASLMSESSSYHAYYRSGDEKSRLAAMDGEIRRAASTYIHRLVSDSPGSFLSLHSKIAEVLLLIAADTGSKELARLAIKSRPHFTCIESYAEHTGDAIDPEDLRFLFNTPMTRERATEIVDAIAYSFKYGNVFTKNNIASHEIANKVLSAARREIEKLINAENFNRIEINYPAIQDTFNVIVPAIELLPDDFAKLILYEFYRITDEKIRQFFFDAGRDLAQFKIHKITNDFEI